MEIRLDSQWYGNTIYSEMNFNNGIKIGCPFSAVYETLVCLTLSPSRVWSLVEVACT